MHHESNADLLQQIDLEIKELLNKGELYLSRSFNNELLKVFV